MSLMQSDNFSTLISSDDEDVDDDNVADKAKFSSTDSVYIFCLFFLDLSNSRLNPEDGIKIAKYSLGICPSKLLLFRFSFPLSFPANNESVSLSASCLNISWIDIDFSFSFS